MTILKRLSTALVLLLVAFPVAYFGICIVGGGVSGAIASNRNPEADSHEIGRQAGAGFVRDNMPMILVGALAISVGSSLALSFSGVFPWCRKPAQLPPPLNPH